MEDIYQSIDVPFHFRHVCWFCGEPANKTLNFPFARKDFIDCLHPPISLPSCAECLSFAKDSNRKHDCYSIWDCREIVKKAFVKHYRKDLAIGKNWTQEELANSGFEGGNFEGFARSAWFVFEVAQQRMNFSGWPLWRSGVQITNNQEGKEFVFDGVTFIDVNQAIDFYVSSFDLHRDFFKDVLQCVGVERFSYAIRFCRLLIGATPNERKTALFNLSQEQNVL